MLPRRTPSKSGSREQSELRSASEAWNTKELETDPHFATTRSMEALMKCWMFA
jgi:hypothetical protein